MQAFEYQALSTPSSIRLLSTETHGDDPATYSIREVDLDHKPIFDALSYTWRLSKSSSGPEPGGHIVCDNTRLAVTANLAAALSHLSTVGRTGPIWIDQLCINQSNLFERSAQVNMMGRIFRSATIVVAWLGLSPGISLRFVQQRLDFMRSLPRVSREALALAGTEQGRKQIVRDVVNSMTTLHHVSDWLGISDLFLCSWFTRCWIIQEVLLAQHIVVYYCGQELEWDLLWSTVQLAQDIGVMNYNSLLQKKHHVLSGIAQILTARDRLWNEDFFTLGKLLTISRSYECTDSRDHVFSILSIPRLRGVAKDQMENNISADYTKSLIVTYTDCMTHLLNSSAEYAPLSLVEASMLREAKGLPSWVPDFRVPLQPIPFDNLADPVFRATGSCLHKPFKFLTPQRLAVQAVRWGVIEDAGETWEEISYGHRLTRILKLLLEAKYRATCPSGLDDAIWRLLIANSHDGQNPAPEGVVQYFSYWLVYQILKFRLKANGDPSVEFLCPKYRNVQASSEYMENDYLPESVEKVTSQFMDSFPSIVKEDIMSEFKQVVKDENKSGLETLLNMVRTFDTSFALAYEMRRLFITKRGSLGMGAQSLLVGDIVILIDGAPVPYILRGREDGTFMLVGECYIHGIMHGEAFEEASLAFSQIEIV